jgi:hypothetical protein
MVIIIIQFNSCLFTCKLNSPKASYKVSTGKKKQQQQNTKQGSVCNSIITIPWKKIVIVTVIVIIITQLNSCLCTCK